MLVARFNREGMAAVFPRQGGGHPACYPVADRERILAEARRVPDRERDGTAVWLLLIAVNNSQIQRGWPAVNGSRRRHGQTGLVMKK